MDAEAAGEVVAVSRSGARGITKEVVDSIVLVAGHGVEGDIHAGSTVQHASRIARDPSVPNLRQVHLLHAELLDELNAAGFDLGPGDIGENVLVRAVDLLGLSIGTRLHLGDSAVVEVTGLRNPCAQLEALRPGLMEACVRRWPDGHLERLAGIMSVVVEGGEVRTGDAVEVMRPVGEHVALGPV